MKKFTIFTAALALMASASCVKETIAPETVEGDGVSFIATRADFGTKTQLVDGCKVEWKVGDKLSLYNTNGTHLTSENDQMDAEYWRHPFPFISQANGPEAKFVIVSTDNSAKAEGAQPYIFVYPYDYSFVSRIVDSDADPATDPDIMQSRFWLRSEQTATLGSFDPACGFSVAKSKTLKEKVLFKNVVSLLKFTVPASMNGRITKIEVKGNKGELVGGDLLCDYSGAEPVMSVFKEVKEYYSHKSGYTSVCLKSATGMAAGDYYLAIVPRNYSEGLTVTVTDVDGKTYTRKSSGNITLERNVIYDMDNVGAENYSGPGIALPYVFSLFATNGEDNTPKYLTQKNVVSSSHLQLLDNTTGAVFDTKTTGKNAVYWSNKWCGHDNVLGQYFTTKESAGDAHKDSYYMLTAPLRVSLPQTFRVSFGFFIDSAKPEPIKDWKLQYSKDATTWYDGATYEFDKILEYHSTEITPEVTFAAGDVLYLKWFPVGNANQSGGTTTGMNNDTRVQFANGVVISDVTSPDSKASGNVYAEDFDRISGGVDYRHAGQTNGIEQLGLLGEVFGDGIENWTAEQKNGLSGSYVAERPGYVQIGYATYANNDRNGGGATNHVGSLVTPALTKASGTLNLSFKAMCYRSPYTGRDKMGAAAQADITNIVVNIKGSGSFEAASDAKSVTLTNISTSKFDKQSLTIYNSDATTQIEFTSTAVSGKFTRWFLDDICVSK